MRKLVSIETEQKLAFDVNNDGAEQLSVLSPIIPRANSVCMNGTLSQMCNDALYRRDGEREGAGFFGTLLVCIWCSNDSNEENENFR